MKFDLNISKVKFITNVLQLLKIHYKRLLFKNQRHYNFHLNVLVCIF